jgi:hypothetical protein
MSHTIAKHLDLLIGFSLSPIAEPSPGFRQTAARYVLEKGITKPQDFNADDLLANRPNAFDGYPLQDTRGFVLYPGKPTTVHYRGGAILGVSIPIYFRSVFK